jgi:hypothetical protein
MNFNNLEKYEVWKDEVDYWLTKIPVDQFNAVVRSLKLISAKRINENDLKKLNIKKRR